MHLIAAALRNRGWTIAVALIAVALLVPATAGAISSRTLIAPTGEAPGDVFGVSAHAAGDVNGDGYPDLIVGAYAWNSFQGRAYVYYGGPGADAVADLTLTGEPGQTYFGYQVDTAGDFNGDGHADMVVGAYNYNSQQGRVYVYYGGPAADAVADLTITGPATGLYFSWSLGTAGDVNRDGYGDLIVGAHAYNSNQGRAYIYYGGAVPDPAPDVTLTGDFVDDRFGWSVSTAGDVNGDGFADVIIGAYSFQPDGGRAYVYYGGAAMDVFRDQTLTAPNQGTYFAYAVGTAGDMNGDGKSEVVVGAFHYNGDQGRAYIYFGGAGLSVGAPNVTLTGEWASSYFGMYLAPAGDVNGDGYADVVVGAWGYYPTGRTYVYFGGATVDAVADLTLEGEDGGTGFGRPVAGAGDIDGDGFDDLIVCGYNYGGNRGRVQVKSIYPYQVVAPNGGEQWVADQSAVVRWRGHDPADLAISYDGGSSWSTLASGIGGLEENEFTLTAPSTETSYAMVRLSYSGQTAKHSTSDVSDRVFRIVRSTRTAAAAHRLQWTLTGEAPGDVFGISVGTAGDVNGDGYADAIVGSYNNAGGRGRVYIYYGGPAADAVADLTLTGEAGGNYFGMSAGTAGDVNGDGYADVIVGASGYGGGLGRAYIYYGGPALDAIADVTLTPAGGTAYFGYSVGTAGDVNRDGYADVIVGAYGGQGRAFVYYGGAVPDAVADLTLSGGTPSEEFGIAVGTAGDVNGDGYADVIVGASAFNGAQGRAYVFYGGSAPNAIADLTMKGETTNNYFGIAVGTVGDMNGDGFADFAIGANYVDSSRGRVYVYYGGFVPDAAADLTISGEEETSFFGGALSSAGDVNHDGYSDLVVGAFNYGGGRGRAYVFYGSPAPDGVPDVTLTGQALTDVLGAAIGTAGDMNGDGYADLAVPGYGYNGYQGRVYLYDFNRYFLTAPNGGETWNVGATKTISWLGAEKADVWLSVDAGRTYDRIATGLGGAEVNSWPLRVPHAPGKFSLMKVTPSDASVGGQDRSDSTFTIQTSVALLALLAAPAPAPYGAGAAVITWNTDPGPDDLAGYRLEKASGNSWQTLIPLTRATSYTDDAAGGGGARYRLFAVNGFGEELLLGETSVRPMRALTAWPVPYRGGNLTISFATANALGGGAAPAEVSVFDVSGRLVRTVVKGLYGAAFQTAAWDGRDAGGRRVPAGIYFIRAESAGQVKTLKLAVLR